MALFNYEVAAVSETDTANIVKITLTGTLAQPCEDTTEIEFLVPFDANAAPTVGDVVTLALPLASHPSADNTYDFCPCNLETFFGQSALTRGDIEGASFTDLYDQYCEFCGNCGCDAYALGRFIDFLDSSPRVTLLDGSVLQLITTDGGYVITRLVGTDGYPALF